jgi:hypothetical protein
MQQATIWLKMSKEHHVQKSGVTPMQALVYVAMFHALAGENPVEVIESTVTETGYEVMKDKEVEVDTIVVKDGKKVVETKKEMRPSPVFEKDNRTIDQEQARLRGMFGKDKTNAILGQIRELPTEFKKTAGGQYSFVSLGLGAEMPKQAFANQNASSVASVKAI